MRARDQCCPPVARFAAADWGQSWPSAAWALGQVGGRNHRKGWLASPCCVWRGLVRRLLVRGQHSCSCSCWLSAGESPRPAAHSSSSRKGKTDRRSVAPHPQTRLSLQLDRCRRQRFAVSRVQNDPGLPLAHSSKSGGSQKACVDDRSCEWQLVARQHMHVSREKRARSR
jgi:hypothetical protein